MSFYARITNAAINLFRPDVGRALGEREALRQLFDPANSVQARLPNRWYRLVNMNGTVVGFTFCCNCLTEYTALSAQDASRNGKCPACQCEFNLYRDLGITDAGGTLKVTRQSEIDEKIAALPVRPAPGLANKRPPFISTWEQGWDGQVGYEGDSGDRMQKAFEHGDPAAMGPGFGWGTGSR